MDLQLDEQQTALVGRLERLAEASAGRDEDAPAILESMRMEGLLGIAGGMSSRDLLDASLLAMEASRLRLPVPLGVHLLVLPLFGTVPAGKVAAVIDERTHSAPVRYATQASLLVRIQDETAYLHAVDPHDAQPVRSNYGYPLGRPALPAGPAISEVPAAAARARLRLALAADVVGAMDASLQTLIPYLTTRRQFNRPLASFQAVQHRLAELAIDVESARWLVRTAAWRGDDAFAAIAAAFAARAARKLFVDAHQLAGAMGFTLDFGMSRDTLRLQMLSVEAGGASAHEAAAFSYLWPGSA